MYKRFFILVNWQAFIKAENFNKLFNQKHLLPLGFNISHIDPSCNLAIKFRTNEEITFDDNSKIHVRNDQYFIKSEVLINYISKKENNSIERIYFLVEGSNLEAEATIYIEDRNEKLIEKIRESEPSLRIENYDLPPIDTTLVDAPLIVRTIFNLLVEIDNDLFSIQTDRFLKSPPILSSLFTHIMSLKSVDNLHFITQLKKLSDHLRELLVQGNLIRKINKDHHKYWAECYGQKVSFLDGGVSRIVGLPTITPSAVRVGIYSVIPGERDLERREDWRLHPFIISDVFNDKSLLAGYEDETDTRRVIEAARYIFELLTALNYINNESSKSNIMCIHGPLVNRFVTYDEVPPVGIPGLNEQFLQIFDITSKNVVDKLNYIPKNSDGNYLWNQPIPIYGYILKRIFEQNIPIVGVVERSHSQIFIKTILKMLVDKNIVRESYTKKFQKEINKYEITDDFLFGCLLNEGEYIVPQIIEKNPKFRAHDKWQEIIDQYPKPFATLLKVSNSKFPYRVEINRTMDEGGYDNLFGFLYHTSLLLRNYVFPVGLDIVDKYAKIPDWLSSGVSSSLTAFVLSKALQTGDEKVLMSVRQLLAGSPRDFFFRPISK